MNDQAETKAQRARRRALRAAQVATISAVMLGCNLSHRVEPAPPPIDSGSAPIADASVPPPPPLLDAGPPAMADAGTDAGVCVTMEDGARSEACCTMLGGSWWDERCSWIIEGPPIPPLMNA